MNLKIKEAWEVTKLLIDHEDTVSCVLIGNNIVNILLVIVVGTYFIADGKPTEVSDAKEPLIFVFTTLPLIIFGEIFAKNLAMNRKIGVLKSVSIPLFLVNKILYIIYDGLLLKHLTTLTKKSKRGN